MPILNADTANEFRGRPSSRLLSSTTTSESSMTRFRNRESSPAIEAGAAVGGFLPRSPFKEMLAVCVMPFPQFVKLQAADWSRQTDLCSAESSFTNRQTVVRDTPCFFATRVRLKPVLRSQIGRAHV